MQSEDPFSPMFAEKKAQDFSPWNLESDQRTPSPETEEKDIQAEQLVERERILEQAREEGYAQGMKEGQEALGEYEQKLQTIMTNLNKPLQQLNKQVDQEVLLSVAALCRGCIGVELSLHPEKLKTIWQTIKTQLPVAEAKPELHLSQADLEWMQTHIKDKESKVLLDSAKVDDRFSSGDFQLDFPQGEVDGRLAKRIKNVVQAALGNMNFEVEDNEEQQE